MDRKELLKKIDDLEREKYILEKRCEQIKNSNDDLIKYIGKLEDKLIAYELIKENHVVLSNRISNLEVKIKAIENYNKEEK